jgi:N-methylhydantoinase A
MRVSVDIGGTFTDLAAFDAGTGVLATTKVPTVPEDQSSGFIDALRAASIDPWSVEDFVHGSTVGINALLERRTARVGVFLTAGFGDLLDLRRLWREHLFGNWWHRPSSLVTREQCFEVPERILRDGTVAEALDEDSVRAACRALRAQGAWSIAVCLLHSYANPAHERRTGEIVTEEFPDAMVTLSSDVLPEIREYERAATTVVSAMLKPVLATYLLRLHRLLAPENGTARLNIMRSNGGVMTPDMALRVPSATLLSGPAGGVTAAAHVARSIGAADAITFDMGGTSTDVGLVENGEPLTTMQRELEWDIPVRGPALDVTTIGAGGGSIAWIDSGGGLHVGPQSAGARPGPACYALGGDAPTVTDANVVLGRISPDGFLHGAMSLDVDLARAAVDQIARPYGWSPLEAAAAIWRIAHTNMSHLIRERTINRGLDPRRFTLMSFGGAGGLFASELARDLGIPQVCVPLHASAFSALGGLLADLAHDVGQTFLCPASSVDIDELSAVCGKLRDRCLSEMDASGLHSSLTESFALDVRYIGQGFELTVPTRFDGAVTSETLAEACTEFHARHEQLYSFARPSEPLELVNVRYRATVPVAKPAFAPAREGESPSPTTKRQVYFDVASDLLETRVFIRAQLGARAPVVGPAIIQEPDTVTVVAPGQTARLDGFGNLLVETAAGA